MTGLRRLPVLLATVGLILAACSSAASPTPAPASVPPASVAPASVAPASEAPATPIPGGLLDAVMKAGTIRVSTDPNYAPQSFLKPDGTYEGFDIDVANEIGKRLGVKVDFVTPGWDVITAGKWANRWDISVGSMTITVPRQQVLDFTVPYYYTPAQMAATTKSGITTLDGLAGKDICVGSATTYQDWLNGTLQSVSLGPVATPPAGAKAHPMDTDQLCAQAIKAGQNVGDGFLTAGPTVDQAISIGTPVVKVGDPVYTEQLAVSLDKSGLNDADMVTALNKIIADMHNDGTLTNLSMKWYKADLTKAPGA